MFPLRLNLRHSCTSSLCRVGAQASSHCCRFPVARNFSTGNVNDPLVKWCIEDEDDLLANNSREAAAALAGRLGRLTLNAPATYNALTVEMGHEFRALIQQISHDIAHDVNGCGDIGAILLTGRDASTRAFSAGGNLTWLYSLSDNAVHDNTNRMLDFYHSFLCIRQLPVPVIAVLEGPAVGAGAGLALACDVRTAAPHPRLLGLNFTRVGIHSGMGASHYLPQLANSPGHAMSLMLRGHYVSGEDCFHRYGLVHSVSENALSDAYQVAREIVLEQHPLAVRLLLQTLRAQQDVGLEQSLQCEAVAQAMCYRRGDWGEGLRSNMERRPSNFDGYHEH